MSKTNRDLRKFVTALLKYTNKRTKFPTEFTADEISRIFNGWDQVKFNLVHNGAGVGVASRRLGHDRQGVDYRKGIIMGLFLVGLFVGTCAGVMILALMIAASDHNETGGKSAEKLAYENELLRNNIQILRTKLGET